MIFSKTDTGIFFSPDACVGKSFMNSSRDKFNTLEEHIQNPTNAIEERILLQLCEMKSELSATLSRNAKFKANT